MQQQQQEEEGQWIIKDATAEVQYWPGILHEEVMQTVLQEVPWQRERVMMRGKITTAPRFTAGLGDAGLTYRYAGQVKTAQPWTPHVQRLKGEVERITGQPVNFALCNYYPDGAAKLSAHSDDTRDLVPDSRIVSLSLGASRDFIFERKEEELVEEMVEVINPMTKTKKLEKRLVKKRGPKHTKKVLLQHGDVLTMGGHTQTYWKHSIPQRLREKQGRVNITFRLVKPRVPPTPVRKTALPLPKKQETIVEEMIEDDESSSSSSS